MLWQLIAPALIVSLGCGSPTEITPLRGPAAHAQVHHPADPADPNRPTPLERFGQLSIANGRLVDASGAPVQLRGVSTQWLNWEQAYATSPEVLAWLRDDWGLSVVRVANGVEYSNGYLTEPEARLNLVKDIVQNALDAGVYVIVDWHTHQLAQQPHAEAFFDEMARTFGDQPNVIYEIFNEPGQLDWSRDLWPYHTALVAQIRKHDPDNLIVVGTPHWDQRPDKAIARPIADPGVLYALHFYACTHGASIRGHAQQAVDAGLPLFVTEWAATPLEVGFVFRMVCEQETLAWHDWMDHNGISWTAWKLSTDVDLAGMLSTTASTKGGWAAADLKGHGPLVRRLMIRAP